MGLHRQERIYYVEMYINGRRTRKSTGTTDKRLAERIYAKMKLDAAEGRFFQKDQGNRKTFEDMAKRYMAEYAIKKPEDSKRRDETSLKHLLPVFSEKHLAQITSDQIARYKVQREREGAAASSINKELALAKHVYNLAIREWEWTANNPFAKVPMEPVHNERVRFLTEDEYPALLNACDNWLRPIVRIAVHTGMRQGNILNLKWQEVDLGGDAILLEHIKSGGRLRVPMDETVKGLLRELSKVRHITSPYVFHDSNGNRFSASTVQHAFQRVCKKAGISNFKFHDLRHTFASHLAQRGISLDKIQSLLGHKEFKMTQRYAHLLPKNFQEAVNVLDSMETALKTAIPAVDRSNESS